MAGLLDALGLQNSLGSGGLLGGLNNMYGGQDRLQGLLLTLGGNPQVGAMLMQQAAQREAGDRFGREFGSIYGGGQPQQASPAAAPAGLPMAPRAASTTGKIYGNDEPSPLDPPSGQDRDLAIRTMLAEAGNQGPQGLNAVGSVIRNRAVAGNFGGDTPTGVVQAPNQFEPWNTAGGRSNMAAIDPNSPRYQAADQALTQAYAGNDPTMGATHFFAPKAQAALGRDVPSWGRSGGQDIGDHRFFGGAAGAQQTTSADPNFVPPGRTTEIAAGQQPVQIAQAAPQQPDLSPRAMQLMKLLRIQNLPESDRKLGEMLLQREMQNSLPKPTSDITEYERAQRDPAFKQYLIDMKRAGKPETNISIDNKAESKFEEEFSKGQAKRWNGYIEAGQAAQRKTVDIDNMREISRRMGSQGKLADAKEAFGPYAAALGIEVEGLSDIQAYSSIIQRLAPQMRAEGSGSTSDIEFKGFIKSLPTLVQNPAAREMTLDTMEALNRDEMSRGEIATKLATKEVNRTEAEKMLRALPDPMQSYKDWRKSNSTIPGNKGAPGVIDYREFFK